MKKDVRRIYTSVLFIFVILLSFNFASAHQPRFVFAEDLSSPGNAKLIQNPGVSQAFYGELKGKPEYYKISSAQGFPLYLQMLSPDVLGARTDFVFIVSYENMEIVINGSSVTWTRFYEPFGGDVYLQGPDFFNPGKGDYLIKVYNRDNRGKYVLIVGEKETFPLKETLNAVISMPKLKKYMGKSPLTAFSNLIGVFLASFIIIIAIIVIAVIKIVRRFK